MSLYERGCYAARCCTCDVLFSRVIPYKPSFACRSQHRSLQLARLQIFAGSTLLWRTITRTCTGSPQERSSVHRRDEAGDGMEGRGRLQRYNLATEATAHKGGIPVELGIVQKVGPLHACLPRLQHPPISKLINRSQLGFVCIALGDSMSGWSVDGVDALPWHSRITSSMTCCACKRVPCLPPVHYYSLSERLAAYSGTLGDRIPCRLLIALA